MKLRRASRTISQSSSLALAIALAIPASIALPAAASAQEAGRSFNIPAGDLATALQAFQRQTGIQSVYSSDLVAGKRSPGVSGTMSAQEALGRLLAGTGLAARVSGNTATLVGAGATGGVEAADGERVLGAVRVEGSQGVGFGREGQAAGVNGVNGSRDITATEGTGSFTSGAVTVGSKMSQALKDIPQSISILTSQRLDEMNVVDFEGALEKAPGITVIQGQSSLESVFYSRGFQVTSIQIDGGAPLNTTFGYQPQIDLAQYDHVEILRGAEGVFNGYGDPSGTVNLTRKKPLDHAQVSFSAQIGSWSNYRTVLDATSPIGLDGKLRGRAVFAYQSNDFFYDGASDKRAVAYAVIEGDVTPTTLVSAGISYTKQDSRPWYGGMPRYQDGGALGLPRNTSFVFPWNRWNFETTELFAAVEQSLGGDWLAKLNLTRNDQSSRRKLGYIDGAISRETNDGALYRGFTGTFSSDQLTGEVSVRGSFNLFGQRQEVVFGVNRSDTDGGGQLVYPVLIAGTVTSPFQPYAGGPVYCANRVQARCPAGSIPETYPAVGPVANFDPTRPLFTEPRDPLPVGRYQEYGQLQTGAYISFRLTPIERLHITTGLRWSRYEFSSVLDNLCTTIAAGCASVGAVSSTATDAFSETDVSWPPSTSVAYDFTDSLTGYLGYTKIYESQARLRTQSGSSINPVTGSNLELGFKWAARDGKLNLSLAGYRIQKKGYGEFDDSVPFEDLGNGVSCCYLPDSNMTVQSKGIDFELAGALSGNWQIALSYNYSRSRKKGTSFGNEEGRPSESRQPEHMVKLWTTYAFEGERYSGWLQGLSVSGGVNFQSKAFFRGTRCDTVAPRVDPVTGLEVVNSAGNIVYLCTSSTEYKFDQKPFAVFSGRISYDLSDKWNAAFNIDNIFDKTYYQTVQNITTGNWYGAPRSFTFSINGKW